MVDNILMPVTDGWSTLEIVLNESDPKLELLRFITRHVFPDDADYFVRQIGGDFQCKQDFKLKIEI